MSVAWRVLRAEGVRSAGRRAGERVREALRERALLWRGGSERVPLLNILGTRASPRLGGVQVQLLARLRVERTMRSVALLHGGVLEFASGARRVASINEALSITGARVIHLEGTAGVYVEAVLRLMDEGIAVVTSVHDLSLISDDPHVMVENPRRRELGMELLRRSVAVVFPSEYLRHVYGCEGTIIEPGITSDVIAHQPPARKRVAFAGSVQTHKGAHLLPPLIEQHPTLEWHIFGGGDPVILRALRKRAKIHGYYLAGTLPRLLERNAIDLVVLPSIVPESFSLTLSEAWQAGMPVIAFDDGAVAERIREHGGGWVVEELSAALSRWRSGAPMPARSGHIATAEDAARAVIDLYRHTVL